VRDQADADGADHRRHAADAAIEHQVDAEPAQPAQDLRDPEQRRVRRDLGERLDRRRQRVEAEVVARERDREGRVPPGDRVYADDQRPRDVVRGVRPRRERLRVRHLDARRQRAEDHQQRDLLEAREAPHASRSRRGSRARAARDSAGRPQRAATQRQRGRRHRRTRADRSDAEAEREGPSLQRRRAAPARSEAAPSRSGEHHQHHDEDAQLVHGDSGSTLT
jgi:hypothetical protein